MIYFKLSILYEYSRKMEKSLRYEKFTIDVQRATLAKHLRSKRHLEKLKHQERIITEWLFQELKEIVYIIVKRI